MRRAFDAIPRLLASRIHIVFLLGLLVGLVILPALGIYEPSASTMLIGGNWTNVTSALGACIASASGVSAVRNQRRLHNMLSRLHEHHGIEEHE